MSEERRVFKMETILNLIAGKTGSDVTELLAFLCQRDLSVKQEGVAWALAKAWIFSQHPPFMECKFAETAIYEDWVGKEVKRLGDNLSIEPIPAPEVAPINDILDELAANQATIAEQAEQVEGLEAELAALKPIPAKIAPLEKKIEDLTAKIKTLDDTIKQQKAKIAEFNGMLPVSETEINSVIKDIVTKALKDAVASVPLGGPAGGAAAAEGGATADAVDAGGVPDSFGFGASDGGGDGFSF